MLAAEPVADLGEPVLLLLVHVVGHILDEDRGLRLEPLVLRRHLGQLDDEDVGDVVLLVRLEDVVLQVGQ